MVSRDQALKVDIHVAMLDETRSSLDESNASPPGPRVSWYTAGDALELTKHEAKVISWNTGATYTLL